MHAQLGALSRTDPDDPGRPRNGPRAFSRRSSRSDLGPFTTRTWREASQLCISGAVTGKLYANQWLVRSRNNEAEVVQYGRRAESYHESDVVIILAEITTSVNPNFG